MGNATDNAAAAYSDSAIDDLIANGASAAGSLGAEGAAGTNLEVGLGNWRAALSTSSRNHILVFGDSNSVGVETWRWPNALKTALVSQTSRPDGGPGWRHLLLGSPEWTFGNVWAQFSQGVNDIGPDGSAYYVFGGGNFATWTPQAGLSAHDRFVIYGVDVQGIVIADTQYSLNGGAFTNASLPLVGPAQSSLVNSATIVGTVSSNLRFQGVNPFGPSGLAGLVMYNGDGTNGPLVVHNLAMSGTDTDTWTGSKEVQPDVLVSPYTRNPGLSNRLAIVDKLQPKLSIIFAGGREFTNYVQQSVIGSKAQMSLANFEANLKKMVERCRLYGDVLVLSPHAFKVPDPFNMQPQELTQAKYAAVARRVAYNADAAHINLNALWNSWTRLNARGYMLDSLHLNQFGHTRLANFLARTFSRIG